MMLAIQAVTMCLVMVNAQVKFPGQGGDVHQKNSEIKVTGKEDFSPVEGEAQQRLFGLFDDCSSKCRNTYNRVHDDHCCRKGHSQCCAYGNAGISPGFGNHGVYGGFPNTFPTPGYGGHTGHGGHLGHGGQLGYGGLGPYGGHGNLGNYGGYGAHGGQLGYNGFGGSPVIPQPGLGGLGVGGYPGYGGIGYNVPQCPKQGPLSSLFGLRSAGGAQSQETAPSGDHQVYKREATADSAGDKASTRFLPISNPLCANSCHSDYDCHRISPSFKCCVDFYNCRKCINPYGYH